MISVKSAGLAKKVSAIVLHGIFTAREVRGKVMFSLCPSTGGGVPQPGPGHGTHIPPHLHPVRPPTQDQDRVPHPIPLARTRTGYPPPPTPPTQKKCLGQDKARAVRLLRFNPGGLSCISMRSEWSM